MHVLSDIENLVDLNALVFSAGNTSVSIETYEEFQQQTLARRFTDREIKNSSSIVPLAIHTSMLHAYALNKILPAIETLDLSIISTGGFVKLNNCMIENFARLESSGMKIDREVFDRHFSNKKQAVFKNSTHSFVYTRYNLFTSTGRPSNSFANINYAALKKDDNSREAFISRYKSDGFLFLADYSAYHPRLISKLIKYDNFPENAYLYIGQNIYGKQSLTDEELKTAKTATFSALYGYIPDEYLHVEFFRQTKQYIDLQWNSYNCNSYVDTPVYKRKITGNNIQDPNPNKLFNYILQAYETERNNEILSKLFVFLKSYKTRPILYIYDSLLFDVPNEEASILKSIADIMQVDNFYMKFYRGSNYNNLSRFEIN